MALLFCSCFLEVCLYLPWASALGHCPFQRIQERSADKAPPAVDVVLPGQLMTNEVVGQQNDTHVTNEAENNQHDSQEQEENPDTALHENDEGMWCPQVSSDFVRDLVDSVRMPCQLFVLFRLCLVLFMCVLSTRVSCVCLFVCSKV